ncbi:hypothetical protein ACQVP2_29480 [Methylobacterium aquaticum]|uniref:hypothetical protein n=1 Tax=Methylobacterium aquaticum TaxID=270351 RepID=UPI003D16E3AB
MTSAAKRDSAHSGVPGTVPLDLARRRRAMNGAGRDDDGSAIRIKGGEQPRVVDEAEAALIAAGEPLFIRAGKIVSPITEQAQAAGDRTTIVARLNPLCADALTDILGRVATFQRYSEQRQQWYRVDPPQWIANMLLVRRGRWNIPAIAGVIAAPTMRPDGSILSIPGYDPTTRLYLLLDPSFSMPPVDATPSRQRAEEALKLLLDLLAEFPFAGEIDRAVALSGILTSVARPGLPVVPLHAIRARSAGTGKSYLIDLCSVIATGRLCPAATAGKTEEETEKRLGAMLLQGDGIISIDNVNGELGGDLLCQITERTIVRPRILGKSEAPDIECRAMVFANGNNLTMVGDMVRRTVLCTLDAAMERPELRAFSFDPIQKALSERGTYVAAVLTILRAYRAAGSPRVCGPIGSYGAWSDTVRSALVWLGEVDPVKSMETTREEDPDLGAQRGLFEHWREHLAEGVPYSTTQIIEIACERNEIDGTYVRPLFRETLMKRAASRGLPTVNPVSLGKWLNSINGKVADKHKIQTLPDNKNGNRYVLYSVRDGGYDAL